MAPEHECGDDLVDVQTARLPTVYGPFAVHAFVCPETRAAHIALVRGRVRGGRGVLVRVQSQCVTGDVFGSTRCDCGPQLDRALRAIARKPRGVLLYLSQEGRGIGMANKIAAYHLQDRGLDTVAANELLGFPPDARDYRCAAAMLRSLGVSSVELMTNNPAKIRELQGNGIRVSRRIPLATRATAASRRYLRTKRVKMGHLLRE